MDNKNDSNPNTHPTNVSNIDDYVKILLDNDLVIVDFYTTWCGPCKKLAPYFNELCEKYGSAIKFCKVDGDQAEEIITKCNVEAFPTVVFYKGAQRCDVLEGYDPDQLHAKCQQLLENGN